MWAVPGVWSLLPGSCSWSLLFHTVLGKSAYLRKTVTSSGVGAEVHFSFSFALNPLNIVEQKTTVVHPGESGVIKKAMVGNVIILCISWH